MVEKEGRRGGKTEGWRMGRNDRGKDLGKDEGVEGKMEQERRDSGKRDRD